MPWTPISKPKNRNVIAVAIYNFFESEPSSSSTPWRLRLTIGDTVQVLEECQGWYYGRLTANKSLVGIFPKSFVVLLNQETSPSSCPMIVSEVTSVLREWSHILREKYVSRKEFKPLRDTMREVMTLRSSLLGGKLPAEEVKDVKKRVTSKMDFMNHHLGLDLVVRHPNGTVVNPDSVSAISLYRRHETTARKINTMMGTVMTNGGNNVGVGTSGVREGDSFQIMLTVKSFVNQKLNCYDEIELIFSIYEVSEMKSPKPLCENYIYVWNKKIGGCVGPTKVLFVDISRTDIANKRLFLICNAVAEGNYCGNNSSEQKMPKTKLDLSKLKKEINFRKAIGVAAVEITDQFTFRQGKRDSSGREAEIAVPFMLSNNESENLEATFKKLINSDRKTQESNRSLWIKLNVMFGGEPVDQTGSVTARKIGLPDIILPSDVRNDLYITLVSGEFSRLDKRQDRNVEVTVEVCDNNIKNNDNNNENDEEQNGSSLRKSVSAGVGSTNRGQSYSSVVYYHDAKPRWNEVIKIAIPVEAFAGSHVRFLFRHRSRNDTKEKSAPWAMAFLKLVSDNDGTAIKDGPHELLVYKFDKKFEGTNPAYLTELPDLKKNQYLFRLKNSNNLSMLPKDSFVVHTALCSTKLTQNEGLLSLLKWRSESDRLFENLQIFKKKVQDNGHEVVKFLPDVLDALFSILMENKDSESNDQKVFKILIFVIQIVTDAKYEHFIPVLEMYIQDNFSATLAYNKLLVVLKDCVEMGTVNARDLTETMKSLKYVFKFVVRSRTLFSNLNGGRGKDTFEDFLKKVLMVIVKLMFATSNELSTAQEYCLRHMVQSIPDLATVFDSKALAEILMQMIRSIPRSQLPEQKMNTINDLVHSQLFVDVECRSIMLPDIVIKIREMMEDDQRPKLIPICTQTLGDILDLLSDSDRMRTTYDDVFIIVSAVLRTVVQSVVNRNNDSENAQALVSIMISLFRQMTPEHYENYIENFNVADNIGRGDLIDFIMEVLLMFQDLIRQNPFPPEWTTMIMMQNSVILKALRHFSHTIRDHFNANFEIQAWNNFFDCAVTFITQPSLQLESFSENKRSKILNGYRDMRKDMGLEVKAMWFNLGQHKIRFIPRIVGPFLKMTLVPETELRRATIPIFFDMMQCEFYSIRGGARSTESKEPTIKGNFQDFEREMIEKMDVMIEDGRGDEYFKILFQEMMNLHCENHTVMRESGLKFVNLIARLLELLLEYRAISQEDNKGNQMSCILNLLEFYKSIKREEMYVRYLKKLIHLHEQCENYSEAAFTILQYSKLLSWSDKILNPILVYKDRHPGCRTHRELKEQLHMDIIANFERGHMWECALKICEVLEAQYKEETFDYPKLAELHVTMSKFYQNIMTDLRPEPEYFRVAFYGRGFAAFLRNKIFIYRGKGYEKLPEFQNRILDQFPNAELMKTLQPPTDEETQLPVQWLQINKVEPVMEEKRKFQGKFIHQQILDYYRVNDVNKFMYSRPYVKDKNKDNEFASLWVDRTVMYTKDFFPGILQWFQIITPTESYQLCPLENAIENMMKTNEELKRLIREHQRSNPPFNPLSMKLKGIIDAAVMGGTAKYEKAFFTDRYSTEHPDHEAKILELQNLMAEQIPLLKVLMDVHNAKKPAALQEFHDTLQSMFDKMSAEVEEKYGRRDCGFNVIHHGSINTRFNNGFSESRMTLHESSTRLSIGSQSSFDSPGNPPTKSSRSSVFSVINGIARKKSMSAAHRNDSSSDLIKNNSDSPTVLITQSLYVQEKIYGSRPCSGSHYLIQQHSNSLTPNHSRSPSITSNRDSVISSNDVFEDDEEQQQESSSPSPTPTMQPIPPLPPPKKIRNGNDSGGDATSISSFEDKPYLVTTTGKKKAPPPPPPVSNTPPTPPKKPPFKLPID